MDARKQAEGEKRVRDLLVEPLLQRGLVKPGHMKAPEFDKMLGGLCAKLAYMSAGDLAALEEEVAARPGGKDRDRFPIANDILDAAARMCPPPVGDSPLIRKVMGHAIGQRAIGEGWAPELLDWLRDNRRWPGDYVLSQVKLNAAPVLRRIEDLIARSGRADELTAAEAAWLGRRRQITENCRRLGAGQEIAECI